MRKSLLIILTAGLILAAIPTGPAQAQLECTDPNLIAVVFENEDINYIPPIGSPYGMQVRLLNPTVPGFNAFEFKLDMPADIFILQAQLPPGAINVGSGQDFIVGLGSCDFPVNGQFVYVDFVLLNVNANQGDFYLQPTDVPSISGEMAFQGCSGPPLIPMYPLSGDHLLPVARINGPPLQYCDPIARQRFSWKPREGRSV